MICIPITAHSNQEAIAELQKASKLADIVELRIDYIENPDLELLLKEKTKPVIVTNRVKDQGGLFAGSEAERIDLLKEAVRLKADYIDVEYNCVDKIQDRGESKLIVSYHDFNETPENVQQIHDDLTKTGADIIKLVTFARDLNDNFRIFELLNNVNVPTIAFCMGESGLISRVLSPVFGGMLTFASLGEGKESAPGQLTIENCKNVYGVSGLNKATHVFGLAGNPVGHSMGPHIHNGAFRNEGVNGVYVPFKVEDVSKFIDAVKKFDIKGVSVTIPHKKSVMEFLDVIDPVAGKIGAVNTVINRDGKLSGYNTDCPAAVSSLERVLKNSYLNCPDLMHNSLNNCKVIILGAGGAARAIAFGLNGKGADITIINRTYESGVRLANDVGCNCVKFSDIDRVEIEVLVNTSPVGMFPAIDESPVPSNILKPGMVVFDIIYNPLETKLLKEAKERGCIILNGVEMFVKQAAYQFELFTGKDAPVKLMNNIINERLSN